MTGDVGFAAAARAEAVNIAGFAALKAVEQADHLDALAREAFVSGMATALRIVAGIIAA